MKRNIIQKKMFFYNILIKTALINISVSIQRQFTYITFHYQNMYLSSFIIRNV